MNEFTATVIRMPTPEQILELAPKTSRPLKIEANVVGYFGDFFQAWKRAVKREINSSESARRAPRDTASAQNQS